MQTTGPFKRFGAFFQVINALRALIVVDFVALLMFTQSDQILETYRVLAETSKPTSSSQQWWIAYGSAICLALALWLLSCILIADKSRRDGWVRIRGPLQNLAAHAIVSLMPMIGLAAGTLISAADNRNLALFDYRHELTDVLIWHARLFIMPIVAIGSVCIIYGSFLHKSANLRKPLFSIFISVFLILYLVVQAVGSADNWSWISGPKIMGPVAILNIWLLTFAVLASLGTIAYDRYNIPVLSTIFFGIIFITAMHWNDNHWIVSNPKHEERAKFDGSTQRARLGLNLAFTEWLDAREHLADPGKIYPVYIVAAEGGGIYAAAHTALVLANLQDNCPEFAQHVFAISAVSGGAYGASLFQTALRHNPDSIQAKCVPTNTSAIHQAVMGSLQSDVFSPLVWSMLFPDLLQKIIPIPIGNWDRGRAFDYSIEEVDPLFSENFVSDACGKHQTPSRCASDLNKAPWLIFNTTTIERGATTIVSPLRFDYGDVDWRYSGLDDAFENVDNEPAPGSCFEFGRQYGDYDVSLATAVGISSRFSWITPPGWIEWDTNGLDCGKGKKTTPSRRPRLTFVDGGYSDASGAYTARMVKQELDRLYAIWCSKPGLHAGTCDAKALKINIRILLINTDTSTNDLGTSVFSSFETLAPIAALSQSRLERGHFEMMRAVKRFRNEESDELWCLQRERVPQLVVDSGLPLGWQLSRPTIDFINSFAIPLPEGDPQCESQPERFEIHCDEAFAKRHPEESDRFKPNAPFQFRMTEILVRDNSQETRVHARCAMRDILTDIKRPRGLPPPTEANPMSSTSAGTAENNLTASP